MRSRPGAAAPCISTIRRCWRPRILRRPIVKFCPERQTAGGARMAPRRGTAAARSLPADGRGAGEGRMSSTPLSGPALLDERDDPHRRLARWPGVARRSAMTRQWAIVALVAASACDALAALAQHAPPANTLPDLQPQFGASPAGTPPAPPDARPPTRRAL